MIDLSILPARLPSIQTSQEAITIQRISSKHIDALCEAGQKSVHHVRPWMGSSLCPISPHAARQCVEQQELSRNNGYGVTYLLMLNDTCLGMGIINYIHPVHHCASLGYWIRPEACGQGLAVAICQSLKKLAFMQMDLHRLELFIEPTNKASIRVAQKLGAEKEGLCRKRIFGRDALLYSVLA